MNNGLVATFTLTLIPEYDRLEMWIDESLSDSEIALIHNEYLNRIPSDPFDRLT